MQGTSGERTRRNASSEKMCEEPTPLIMGYFSCRKIGWGNHDENLFQGEQFVCTIEKSGLREVLQGL